MPSQPGPFKLQPDDAVTVEPGVYNFAADAADMGHQLQGVDVGWNELVFGLEALAADSLADLYSIEDTGILSALEIGSGAAELGSLDALATAYPIADQQLTDALAFAPTSAYADPPIPFAPPASVLNLYTPTVDAGAFDPASAVNVGTSAGTHRPDAELENLTRFGAQNFVVGDNFKVLVLAYQGDVVTVAATRNGQLLGTGTLGTIDYSGDLVVTGTMGPDFIGTWIYAVYVNDTLLKSFYFVVAQ